MTPNGRSDSLELDSHSSNHETDRPSSRIILCHIICRKCHHHHTAKHIEIPPDDTHLRVDCDQCFFTLIGIGRSSIKSYMASVETSSSWEEGPAPSSTACTNGTGANASLGGPSRSGEGTPAIMMHGGPGENNAQIQSSTPRDNSSSNSRADVTRREGASSQTLPQDTPIRTTQRGASFLGKSITRHKTKLKKILEHIKRPQWRPMRYWNSRGNTSSTLTGLPNIQPPGPGDTAHGSQLEMEQEPSGLPPGPVTLTSQISHAGDEPTQTVPVSSDGDENRTSGVTSSPDHVAQPDETPEGVWNPAAEKKERLRIRRRELTLKKKKMEARTCRCGADCHCMGQAQGEATPRSLDSFRRDRIPRHYLSSLYGGHSENSDHRSAAVHGSATTNSDGPHVHFTNQPVEATSPDIPESNPVVRPPSRLSTLTGTTANESSSSGARSARSLAQRANSLPVLRFRHFSQTLDEESLHRYATELRPRAMRALEDFDTIHEPQHASSVPDAEPHHESERTDSTDFATDDHLDRRSELERSALANLNLEDTHGRATSLSRLPQPDDEQHTEEPGENGETESSSTRITLGSGSDDGSNVTARLQNPEQRPAASSQSETQHDEISDALEQMSSESTGRTAEHTTE